MQNPSYKSTLTTRALGPNLMLIHLAKYARKLVGSKDENRLRFKDQTMNTEIALRPFTILHLLGFWSAWPSIPRLDSLESL